MLSRRLFLHGGACVLGAPLINRGRFSLFAGSLDQYSSVTVDLVRESTVIDMLGLLTLDFKKLDTWRTRPSSFHLTDFQRLKDSGITVFHPAVGYVEGDIYAESSADITGWDAFIDSYPQYFIRVCSPADVPRAKAEGKLGIIVGQQNSNHFRTVDDVDAFYKLGQRVSQLTYHDNALGGGSTDPAERGLTPYGESVVARMNELGMAVDISHCGDHTTLIVFAPTTSGPLHRVLAAGGVSMPITALDKSKQETAHEWPQFLPDGQRFLYWARSEKGGIYVQSLGSNQRTFVLETPGRAVFASGFLLFLRDATLMAQRLDLKSLRMEGEPVTAAEDVRTGGNNGRNGFSASENGVLAYRSGADRANVQLSWYTRDGKPAGTALAARDYVWIELSPDDRHVAVERRPNESGTAEVWLLDLSTSVFSRLTTSTDSVRKPIWSSDSRSIVYYVSDGKDAGIREVVIGGADSAVFADGKTNYLDDWSRDGKLLVYHTANGTAVSVLPLSGERKPQVVFQTQFQKDQFRLSPDGRWIAYTSFESANQPEVFLATFPSFTNRRQISTGGGLMPRWRSDGKELYYVSLDRRMMAMEVKVSSTLQLGAVKSLFQFRGALTTGSYSWAVTSDGQKFLVEEPPGASTSGAFEPLHIVVNWPAALGR